jgi:DNA-binding NarL/FixJ family response regulator
MQGESMGASSIRVLIVEDHPVLANQVRDAVLALGHDVMGMVASGESAVLIALQLRPDLVIMDYHLEGEMDGVSAAAGIQARTDARIAFCTASEDPKVHARMWALLPLEVMIKPIQQDRLREVICKVQQGS